jgi:hypothetical protein
MQNSTQQKMEVCAPASGLFMNVQMKEKFYLFLTRLELLSFIQLEDRAV